MWVQVVHLFLYFNPVTCYTPYSERINLMSKVCFLDVCFSFTMGLQEWSSQSMSIFFRMYLTERPGSRSRISSHLYREESFFFPISHSAGSRKSLELKNTCFIWDNDLYLQESIVVLHDFV